MNLAQNEIEDDVKKFLGLPPYHNTTNIVVGDGFFLASLYRKYGREQVNKTLKKLEKGE